MPPMSQFDVIVSRVSMMPLLVFLLILAMLFGQSGCEKQPPAGGGDVSGPPTVIVSIPPLAGLIEPLLAEISRARLITLGPLGDGDWFEMMRTNLDAFVDGLRP